MSLNFAPQTVSAETYQALFEKERANVYPTVDALDQRLGFALDRERLERAAAVLSCPFKAAPPNWQHGRVIYAVTREYLYREEASPVRLLDIGTAKGFSALCLQWALDDYVTAGRVFSVDVMSPHERCRRNTITEVDSLKTLHEILAPWPEATQIEFVAYKHGSREWFFHNRERVHVAYVDGKHSYEAVSFEAKALSKCQQSGDAIIFDDIQIAGVRAAVDELPGYDIEHLFVLPTRGYAIARKQ